MKTVKKLSLISTSALALFTFSACGDSSGAGHSVYCMSESSFSYWGVGFHTKHCLEGMSDDKEFTCGDGKENTSSSYEWLDSCPDDYYWKCTVGNNIVYVYDNETTTKICDDNAVDNNKSGNDPESSSQAEPVSNPDWESDVSSSSVAPDAVEESSSSETEDNCEYGTLLDERDNQKYKTVKIGTQTWMAENLNYAYTGVKFREGTNHESDSTSWCYNNDVSNCDKYGRLYTWSAVMDSAAQFSINAGTECGFGKACTPNSPHRGICPEGWHVPTSEEYGTLYDYIGKSSIIGLLLKSTSGWYSGGNGTDKFCFSVLPAGRKLDDGDFGGEGEFTNLWTATEYDSYFARVIYFYHFYSSADQSNDNMSRGQSLRCLKD